MTAKGRCRETGIEAWSWTGLSRPKDGVGDLAGSMVLEGLSRPVDGVKRLGQKHGLGTVYHGIWKV